MFVDQAARIETGQTIDAVWDGLLEALPLIGMDHAVYISVNADFEDPFVRATIPDIYKETPPREDPFLNHCCVSYEIYPAGLAYAHRYSFISEADREFLTRVSENGLHAGIAIPMRLKGNERFGGFILGNGMEMVEFSARILPRAEELRLFCMIIHRRIEELISEPIADAPRAPLVGRALPDAFDALTPRESEVIVLLAQGKSRAETAEICNISIHTVSDYAKQGYRKLGVRNRAEAAALMLPPDVRR